MPMKPTDRILSAPRGTIYQAITYAWDHGSERHDDVKAYITEAYRLASLVEIDPAIVVAQSALETGSWTSPRWVINRNPAGLGIDHDDASDPARFTGTEAARVHVWALLHACDRRTAPPPRLLPDSASAFVRRWTAKYADPNCPAVATVDDLNVRYTDRNGEPQATWAWDAAYQDGICARGNAIFPDLEDQPVTVPATIDYSSLPFPVGVSLIPESQPNQNPGLPLNPQWVTIHETGSPTPGSDNAVDEAAWVRNGADGQQLSVHFFVDAHQAIQILPLNRVAWHAGDGFDGPGNRTALAIETCIEPTTIHQTRANVRALAALLIRTLPGLAPKGVNAVVQHNRWSGKDCPMICRHEPGCWEFQVGEIAKLLAPKKRGFAKREPIPDPVQDKPWKGEYLIVPKVRRRTLRHDYAPRAHPDPDEAFVAGTVRKAGTTLSLDYAVIGHDTQLWFVSKNGSFFPASAFFA